MEENTLARAVAKVTSWLAVTSLFTCLFIPFVLQTVLSEAASKASREVLITPRYLVPDTNCFVKMLPSIKALVGRAEFVVAIPLIGENQVLLCVAFMLFPIGVALMGMCSPVHLTFPIVITLMGMCLIMGMCSPYPS